MSDTTTTSTPDTPPPSSPPKPGWETTEFYGSWAVKIFGALMAAGVFGEGSLAYRITGAALTILAYFGYTYSRTVIKAAAGLVLVMLIGGSSLTACTKAELGAAATSAELALVNCTGQAIGTTPALDVATLVAVANVVAEERAKCTPPGGSLDWSCAETDAIAEGEVLGGCALAQLFASSSSAPPASARAAAVGRPDPGRAVLEDFRARFAGGATFHTSAGDY